jgi:hypothetical protein
MSAPVQGFRMPVLTANRIRAYWWCSPPRIGRQRMRPTVSAGVISAHLCATTNRCACRCNSSCTRAAHDADGFLRTPRHDQCVPGGLNRSAVLHKRCQKQSTALVSLDRTQNLPGYAVAGQDNNRNTSFGDRDTDGALENLRKKLLGIGDELDVVTALLEQAFRESPGQDALEIEDTSDIKALAIVAQVIKSSTSLSG